jgi:hypothetical protein
MYGASVALEGERLAVGQPSPTNPAHERVFVYTLTGTWPVTTLQDPDDAGRDFGHLLMMRGNVLIVGEMDDEVDDSRFHIYLYSAAGWSLEQTIEPIVQASGFGVGAVLTDDWLAIAAPYNATSGLAQSGTVHLYMRNSGRYDYASEIQPSSPQRLATFGADMAAYGNLLLVSSPAISYPFEEAKVNVRLDAYRSVGGHMSMETSLVPTVEGNGGLWGACPVISPTGIVFTSLDGANRPTYHRVSVRPV